MGIDISDFTEIDSTAVGALRREYGDRVVLSVGRLVYYKGFDYLIRAMTHVRGKLLIIGEGPLRTELQELALSLGVADKVFIQGEIQGKLAPYYHASDVFCLASVARTEAFGIVQVEAMASGLPVVNTALDSGVPFVSLHEQTGLTVLPKDSAALAAALNRLLDDGALRRSFGDAARERARQEFSLGMMAKRTMCLYNAVMGRESDLEK